MSKSTGAKKQIQTKGNKTTGKRKITGRQARTQGLMESWLPTVFLVLGALIILYARLQLLGIPMERDEAGFAYIGHWMLKGQSLYTDLADNKLPGLYLLYSGFTTIFGYNASGVHTGLLLANAVSAICLYILVKDLFNTFTASLATVFFLILALGANVGGFAAHATQLLLPFVIAGWLMFWRGIRSDKVVLFFIAGFLIGFAFIVKQQSIVFGLLAAVIWWPMRLWWNMAKSKNLPWKEWVALGAGGLLPAAMTGAYFSFTGRWDELYFWTYEQPSSLAKAFVESPWRMFSNIFPRILGDYAGIWMAAAMGMFVIWLLPVKRSVAVFSILFMMLGLASVAIGAAFYKHYFVVALPGVALMAAVALNWIAMKLGKAGIMIGFACGLILFLWPLIAQKDYFFQPDYAIIHQQAYDRNMFPEMERIGKELSKRVPPGGRIGVMGSEPGVLVAAQREGCSKHLFMYPLLSDPVTSPPLQAEYVNEMIACSPEYVVWQTVTGSWTSGYDKLKVFKDLNQWLGQSYTAIGMADFRPNDEGIIVWDEALSVYQPQSDYRIYVFKKK